jgi:hypothetical protein
MALSIAELEAWKDYFKLLAKLYAKQQGNQIK